MVPCSTAAAPHGVASHLRRVRAVRGGTSQAPRRKMNEAMGSPRRHEEHEKKPDVDGTPRRNRGLPADAVSGFWGRREYFVQSYTTRRPDKCCDNVVAISLTSLANNE